MHLATRTLPALALLFATGVANAADPPLAVGEVRRFMADVAAASTARDIDRIAALLSPDSRIELRTRIGDREQVSLFTRADYVAMLRSGYAGMSDLSDYDYKVDAQQVTLESDPPGATVVSAVTESFTFHGQRRRTHSEETARVERRGGRPLLVAVSSLTEGD